jgi:hypothetical protein
MAVNALDMQLTAELTAPDRTAAVAMIDLWQAERPTGLMSRSRVIDRLLDLRNVLPAPDRFRVDFILADVPGVTVVEAEWWLAQVEQLRTQSWTPPTYEVTP